MKELIPTTRYKKDFTFVLHIDNRQQYETIN